MLSFFSDILIIARESNLYNKVFLTWICQFYNYNARSDIIDNNLYLCYNIIVRKLRRTLKKYGWRAQNTQENKMKNRILFIDDQYGDVEEGNNMIIELTFSKLLKNGFEFLYETAEDETAGVDEDGIKIYSVERAIARIKEVKDEVDLVVCDMWFGGLGGQWMGLEIMKKAKTLWPELNFIIMSSSAKKVEKEILEWGCKALEKMPSWEDLNSCIPQE